MNKIHRLGALAAVIFAACLMASPAVRADTSPSPGPASSARTSPLPARIVLGASSTPPGYEVNVTGSGFPANTTIDFYLDGRAQLLLPVGYASDGNGAFTYPVTILGSKGDHSVCAWTNALAPSPASACAPVVVTDYRPTITVSPSSGVVNAQVTIAGRGFPIGAIVALYLDSPNPFMGTPGPSADWKGSFSTGGMIEPGVAGLHNVCGETGPPWAGSHDVATKACTQFTITGGPAFVPPPQPAYPPPPPPSPQAPPSPYYYTPSPAPTFLATPSAAHLAPAAFPIWPVAGGAALLIAAGVAAWLWFRRRSQLNDR